MLVVKGGEKSKGGGDKDGSIDAASRVRSGAAGDGSDVDDPDGIVVDARFVDVDTCGSMVAGGHPWVCEPLGEWLAERFRVPIEYEESSPREDAARQRRERLTALLEQATAYFERMLWETEAGAPVRATCPT